eukprot:131545_1
MALLTCSIIIICKLILCHQLAISSLFVHDLENQCQHKNKDVNIDYFTSQDKDDFGPTHILAYLTPAPFYPLQIQMYTHIALNPFGLTQIYTFSFRVLFDYLSNTLLKIFLNNFKKIHLKFNSFASDPSGPSHLAPVLFDSNQTQTHDPSGPTQTELCIYDPFDALPTHTQTQIQTHDSYGLSYTHLTPDSYNYLTFTDLIYE